MCIISVNQWGNTGFPAMLLWVCLWLEMFLYACVCVCAFASVLTSCPEACDPDVRLWALRTRQEHIVSRDRPARFSPVDIQTHVVSIPVFSIFFFARYTLWYLSRELRVVHYGAKKRKEKKVLVASVCVTEAGCVSALSTSPHCLYTSGRRRRSTRCFHGYGMNVQVITPRITAAIVNFYS